jgi:hypothetical protein
MFNFFSMPDNYEQRKVANFKDENGLTVDTAAVTDSDKPYETGIQHPAYNDGSWVIVELYYTKAEAKIGHDKWVAFMTAEKLPDQLLDVSTSEIAELISIFGDDWRSKPKEQKSKKR